MKIAVNPRQWPIEAWYGVLGAAAWAAITATVGLLRDEYDPSWLDFLPGLNLWVVYSLGVCAVASLGIQFHGVIGSRPELDPGALERILEETIDRAARDGKFGRRPVPQPARAAPYRDDSLEIAAQVERLRLGWGSMREDLRGPRFAGLADPYYLSDTTSAALVLLTARCITNRILRDLRLEVTDARVHGYRSHGTQVADLAGASPELEALESVPYESGEPWPPPSVVLPVGDLKPHHEWRGAPAPPIPLPRGATN